MSFYVTCFLQRCRNNVLRILMIFFFFKQKTAYEMRISDWSSDVCSSDLGATLPGDVAFRLYDTFGFPYDLTEDALRTQGITVDRAGFDAAMAQDRKSVV